MSSIEEKYPELINTDEYVKFQCDECKTINGTTYKFDGDKKIVVCGQCWKKQIAIPIIDEE